MLSDTIAVARSRSVELICAALIFFHLGYTFTENL